MGRKDKPVLNHSVNTNGVGARMRMVRQEKGISLTEMARRVKRTKSHLSALENGNGNPTPTIIEKYEEILELEAGSLTSVVNTEEAPVMPTTSHPPAHFDWDDAPKVSQIYGRDEQLSELTRWVVDDHCTLVSVLGFGGIGKTTLAMQLLERISKGIIPCDFEYVAWYSLERAPSLEQFLARPISFLSDQQQSNVPEDEDVRIDEFLKLLREHRCLVVVDNFESVLKGQNSVGQYQDSYGGYGKLLQRVGESNHQSCLLLTSREKPGEIPALEGRYLSIRSMNLPGLIDTIAVQQFLEGERLSGTDDAWSKLIYSYAGNPLALRLISASIREIFAGNIDAFLAANEIAFGDISKILEKQFERLSKHEQYLMFWLAIERNSATREDLEMEVAPEMTKRLLYETISSLKRRFFLENDDPEEPSFRMQPVILEYITERFVERIRAEILDVAPDLLASHALVKAQAKDYVRNDQVRQIVQVIIERLAYQAGEKGVEDLLNKLLAELHRQNRQRVNYVAGNILNLFAFLKNRVLNDLDFSHLTIQQGYLQRVTLHNVDFSHASVRASLFTETFKGVVSVALSPDGKLLAAGTTTGEIWLWDTKDGTLKLTCKGDASWLCWSVAFSADGSILVSGSEDQHVYLWEVSTGKLLKVLKGHSGWVDTVACSPNSSIVASGSDDATICLWDMQSGKRIALLSDHQARVRSVAFHPEGALLASASDDNTVRIWNAQTGQCLHTLQGHTAAVYSVTFSPDGKLLASGGEDTSVQLWNAETGEHIQTLKGHEDWVWSVAFNPDGSMLASGSEDQSIRLWNVLTEECIKVLTGHTSRVWSLAFVPQTDTLVSGSVDHSIRFWDVRGNLRLRTFQGYTNVVRAIAFSPDGQQLAGAGEDRFLYLWQHKRDEGDNSIFALHRTLTGHTNAIWALAFSPDGTLLASGGDDKTIRLWDAKTGNALDTINELSTWIRALAFSPDSKLLANGGADRIIRLWNISEKSRSASLSGHGDRVRAVVFSPDGKLLASGSDDKTVRLWSIRGKLIRVLKGHQLGVWSVAISPDGKLLASGSADRTIRVWEIATGSCINTLHTHTYWVGSVAFSPMDAILASGDGGNAIRLWDPITGKELQEPLMHTGPVSSIAFSPDGTRLASGSHDGNVIVWDMQTCQIVSTLQIARPYEGLNLAHVTGLNATQVDMMKKLGAIEKE